VHPNISFVLFPGSHRILETMARESFDGHGPSRSNSTLLTDLIAAGVLVSEPSCGSCAGIGHVPAAGAKSLRAFNRNFPGRSGVKDDSIYLCSSLVAAASAVSGVITDPRTLGAEPAVALPDRFVVSDVGFVPSDGGGDVVRGPNIKPVPLGEAVADTLEAPVLLKLGDKVSTDDISPAGSAALMFRANVPAISEFCFRYVDAEWVARAKAAGRSMLVGGEIYGQGSSREVAAIGPMFLGVRAVIVKSFARIHRANLINWGIVPLTFAEPASYDTIERDDVLRIENLRGALGAGAPVTVTNTRTGATFKTTCVLTPRERDILLAGGVLAHTKSLTASA
jgi:aconitate hydratase